MDYMKQIWMDYGLRTHEFYVVGDLIMEIVKDKMSKKQAMHCACLGSY